MPRNHAIFKKSLKNLPSGVCQGCRHQLSNINRNFDDYKYDSDREVPGRIPIHTECLKFILQRIEKYTDKVEDILDICDLASDSKRVCEDCHAEIKQKISHLQNESLFRFKRKNDFYARQLSRWSVRISRRSISVTARRHTCKIDSNNCP